MYTKDFNIILFCVTSDNVFCIFSTHSKYFKRFIGFSGGFSPLVYFNRLQQNQYTTLGSQCTRSIVHVLRTRVDVIVIATNSSNLRKIQLLYHICLYIYFFTINRTLAAQAIGCKFIFTFNIKKKKKQINKYEEKQLFRQNKRIQCWTP